MAVTLDLRDEEGGQVSLFVNFVDEISTFFTEILELIAGRSQMNVTYSEVASSSIELRNQYGFEVC